MALVSGEAGIGKTRLVQELVRRAPAGTLVLAGQADPGTVGRPMELFLDAVDVAASGAAVADDGGTDLAALVAAVRDADRTAEERVRAGVDLVRALGDRAGGGPTLVVFEDLHWADSESITAFERLAEPPPPGAPGAGRGLVLVGTYRPDGLSRRHPAAEAVPRLDRRHRVTHVHLDRLTPGRGQRLPRRRVRPGAVVPRRRRPPRAHRREPVLPRGAGVGGGGDARGRRRRAAAVDGVRAGAAPSSTTSTPTCAPWCGPRRCWAGACRSTCWPR